MSFQYHHTFTDETQQRIIIQQYYTCYTELLYSLGVCVPYNGEFNSNGNAVGIVKFL